MFYCLLLVGFGPSAIIVGCLLLAADGLFLARCGWSLWSDCFIDLCCVLLVGLLACCYRLLWLIVVNCAVCCCLLAVCFLAIMYDFINYVCIRKSKFGRLKHEIFCILA